MWPILTAPEPRLPGLRNKMGARRALKITQLCLCELLPILMPRSVPQISDDHPAEGTPARLDTSFLVAPIYSPWKALL